MSTSITSLPDFNQQAYEALLNQARAQGVAAAQVDSLLLEAANSGQSFGQVAEQVSHNLPRLAPPNGADIARIAEFGLLPSPGALVMSLITKYAGEQREQNREVRHQMTEQIVASMQEEADKMREMAALQLAMGIVSGLITIASGAVQTGMSAAALKTAIPQGKADVPSASPPAGGGTMGATGARSGIAIGGHRGGAPSTTAAPASAPSTTSATPAPGAALKPPIDPLTRSQSLNALGQGMAQAGGGFAGIAKSVGDYYGTMYQAKIKELQADQEKLRDMRDSLKDLDEGLKELIQKALAAQDSIQQAQNQARTKILG
ncbi:MAG: type III secretion system translocon subunit SctB [Zoogloeaceae bacterium]|jgi:hypothetical protein|nr:type III secretion system translocon subunit SctB [Zoogloeaceae bacterium]